MPTHICVIVLLLVASSSSPCRLRHSKYSWRRFSSCSLPMCRVALPSSHCHPLVWSTDICNITWSDDVEESSIWVLDEHLLVVSIRMDMSDISHQRNYIRTSILSSLCQWNTNPSFKHSLSNTSFHSVFSISNDVKWKQYIYILKYLRTRFSNGALPKFFFLINSQIHKTQILKICEFEEKITLKTLEVCEFFVDLQRAPTPSL